MTRFPHLRAAIFGTPWAIMEDRLEAIIEVVERRCEGVRLSAEEISATRGARRGNGVVEHVVFDAAAGGQASSTAGGVIAVINIMGIIAQHASQVDDISGPGGTSTERVSNSFRAAVTDPNVKAIVLNIDSPGGSVSGVQALANEIFKARGKKPIVAQVNSMAASAAYWIGRAAGEMVMTPGSLAGSIGVFATHKDISQAAAKEGIAVTFISAGKFKVEGNPFEPLAADARDYMQAQVDAYYTDFVCDVARFSGVSVGAVRAGFGEGRVVKDKEAVNAGMADSIATLDETLRRLSAGRGASGARASAIAASAETAAVVGAPAGAGSISIITEVADGISTHRVSGDWPAVALVDPKHLEDSAPLLSLSEDAETLAVAVTNGSASYVRRGVTAEGLWVFDLVQSRLDVAVPSDRTEQSAEERDAFRRRRHAMRSRAI